MHIAQCTDISIASTFIMKHHFVIFILTFSDLSVLWLHAFVAWQPQTPSGIVKSNWQHSNCTKTFRKSNWLL